MKVSVAYMYWGILKKSYIAWAIDKWFQLINIVLLINSCTLNIVYQGMYFDKNVFWYFQSGRVMNKYIHI